MADKMFFTKKKFRVFIKKVAKEGLDLEFRQIREEKTHRHIAIIKAFKEQSLNAFF